MLNYLRRYDGQLNFRFGQSLVFGIGAGFLEMPVTEDQRVYRTNLVLPINNRTRVEFSYNKTYAENEEERGLISLYWSEPQGRYSASAYYDSLQKISMCLPIAIIFINMTTADGPPPYKMEMKTHRKVFRANI